MVWQVRVRVENKLWAVDASRLDAVQHSGELPWEITDESEAREFVRRHQDRPLVLIRTPMTLKKAEMIIRQQAANHSTPIGELTRSIVRNRVQLAHQWACRRRAPHLDFYKALGVILGQFEGETETFGD